MSSTRPTDRARWLAPPEMLFLGAVIFAWAILVLALGKDTSWDFRNYHWYIPYAYLNHRMGFDVAVAHQATYYNPTLDIPFYLLANHVPAWLALGTLGAVQGCNVIPIYLIARSMLRVERKALSASILTLFCMTGGLTLGLAGTTYYDNVLSVLTLSGLAILVTHRGTLANGNIWRGMAIALGAGFITGLAVGLKLPQGIFAMGFAGALLATRGDTSHRLSRLVAGGVGGVIGFSLLSAHWWLVMYHVTGNPLFPYFNQYFGSPLALNASYRDLRFIPTTWPHRLLFPLLFTLDWRVADDLAYSDVRVCLAYVLSLATIPILLLFRKREHEPLIDSSAAAPLFAFAGFTYLFWIGMFAIYRYILALEMLSPILVTAAIGLWPLSRRIQLIILGALGALAVACTRPDWIERAPVTDPYVQVQAPKIPNPDRTMVLMAGEAPMGYLIPSLPHQIPVLRIDGWMITPEDGSRLTAATKKRVRAFKGDLYLIAEQYEIGRAAEALADYGLQMRYSDCQQITANLGGPYKFCPVERLTDKTP